MATTVGTIQLIATIDTSRYKAGAKDIKQANKSIEDSTNSVDKDVSKKSSSLTSSLKGVARFGFAALATAAVGTFAIITSRIDNAIRRVDALVAFPRALEAMGVGGDEAVKATEELSEKLTGLPTPLQDGTRAVQNLVAAGLDVSTATDAFLALNNALLAGGADAGAASATMTQLQQALSRGKIEGDEWNSIISNTPTFLQAMVKETGLTRDELRELYRTNPQQLIDDLIRLNEQGGGGLQSLDEQARAATGGIGTAFDNLGNAIDRSWQKIVETIGGGDLEEGQRRISEVISGAKVVIDGLTDGFILFVQLIQEVIGWLQPLFNWISENKEALDVLKTTLVILAGIFAGIVLAAIIIVTAAIAVIIGVIQFLVDSVEIAIQGFIDFGNTVTSVVNTAWKAITDTFSNVGKWFSDRFNDAVNGIKRAFSSIGGFFRGVWNSIVSIFTSVGTAVGNAIGNTFKSVINGILRSAVNIINGFIDGINTVIGIVNNIPGVDIGTLGRLPIPQLADGGIVSSATLAVIGEGSEPEAVIPLSKLDEMLSGDGSGSGATYNITIQASANMIRSETEKREFANMIFEAFNQERRAKGMGDLT